MNRHIVAVGERFSLHALELVEEVFSEAESPEEGRFVRRLVEEIRSKRYYLPELELAMIDDEENVIGYAMFSRFHIEGRYEDELLILTPVAVKTALQRQHISKDLIEYGFEKAAGMGFKAVMVEGNPLNYRPRGFETAANHGVIAGPTVPIPHIDCLMIRALVPGGLDDIHGTVDYSCYDTLT